MIDSAGRTWDGRHTWRSSMAAPRPQYRVSCDLGPKMRESDDHWHGFLCIENDYPTAEAQAELLANVGISPYDVTPWNAILVHQCCPYRLAVGAGPESAFRRPGTHESATSPAYARLVHRRPVASLNNAGWATSRPGISKSCGLSNPGRQALWHRDPDVRAGRLKDRRDKYRKIADLIRPSR